MGRLVWAFEPLEETDGQTGFVDIEDEAVAQKLIDAGKVQDGWEPEGGELKYIDGSAVDAYATRQLKAGGPRAAAPRDDPPPDADPDTEPKRRGRPPKTDKVA